jgi:hypothetical protein
MRAAERIQKAALAVESIIGKTPSGDAGVDPLLDQMEDQYDIVDTELDRVVREIVDWTTYQFTPARLASAVNHLDGATLTFKNNYFTRGYGFAKAHARDLPTSHANRRGQTRKPDLLDGRLDKVHKTLGLGVVGAHNETFKTSELTPAKSRTVESFDASVTAIESAAAFLEASADTHFDDEVRAWSRVRSHLEEVVAFTETASASEASHNKPALKKLVARYDVLVGKLGSTRAFKQVSGDLKRLRERLGAH